MMMNNLLPYDGVAYYYDQIFSPYEATEMTTKLLTTVAWKHEETIMYGRRIITKRKVAWYGDKAFSYTYSGVTKEALPWTNELAIIKEMIEAQSGDTFNSCLLNLYHSGEEGMGWHSDNESSIQTASAIASVSLGAGRMFSFRHKKTKETVLVWLESGSLLLMKSVTQQHWQHSLPKSKKIKDARINLTFRCMKEQGL